MAEELVVAHLRALGFSPYEAVDKLTALWMNREDLRQIVTGEEVYGPA